MTDDRDRAVAINVAANTQLPGVRGPIYPDGSFLYVPIPEREPTTGDVPTYAALGFDDALPVALPDPNRRVHFDPEFAGYVGHDRYTYGDEHGVKAGPLSELTPGDSLVFYATLTSHPFPDDPLLTTRTETDTDVTAGDTNATAGDTAGVTADTTAGDTTSASGHASTTDRTRVGWRPPEWGVYAIGEFRVRAVVTPDDLDGRPGPDHWAATNAHTLRESFDAEVLVRGTDDSRLFDRAVPLSTPEAGASANRLVTDLSNDSGAGPWWRRVLRFDPGATRELRRAFDAPPETWLD